MEGQTDDAYVEPSPTSGLTTAQANEKRLGNVEDLTRAILLVVAISLVGIVVTIVALVIDQIHFNNELYRDGSYNHKEVIEKVVHDKPVQLTFPSVKTSN